MRDIAIVGLIFALVPVILRKPWIGVLVWIWISLMNPHKFAWGFASTFPVALVTGGATLIGLAISKERIKLPMNGTTILLILLPLWMTVTLVFALAFGDAFERWKSVMKVFLFILVTAA